ncbi:MAG: hypothetical protein NVS3B20_19080 [Polyangiales bacterium]
MTESIDAVALLGIADWEPSDDLDIRELDDGALLYLDVPFDAPHEEIADAIIEAVGDDLVRHHDPRGIFLLPDAANVDDQTSYEGVLEAASDVGLWLTDSEATDPDTAQQMLGDGMKSMLDGALSAMGLGNLDDMQRVLREGDSDALQMMQIRMQGAFEQLTKQPAAEEKIEPPSKVSSEAVVAPSPKPKTPA